MINIINKLSAHLIGSAFCLLIGQAASSPTFQTSDVSLRTSPSYSRDR